MFRRRKLRWRCAPLASALCHRATKTFAEVKDRNRGGYFLRECSLRGENRHERKPLRPIARNNCFQDGAPLLHRCFYRRVARALYAQAMDRLAGDNLVPMIARPQDKQGKDWRLRHESETKRAIRQVYISREELHPGMGNISRDSIALDRNNFPLPQRIKQIKRESGAACAVTDLHSAGSRLLHGNID